jgi:streptomycin 6-kinase
MHAPATWGATGERWLESLPATLEKVLEQWELHAAAPMPMSLHYVVAVIDADGIPAVLKLGPPEPGHLAHEAEALSAFDGHGAVRLLAHDEQLGALLLERAQPGTMARELVQADDELATAAAVHVLEQLHRSAPMGCTLPDLEEESDSFAAHLQLHGDAPVPLDLVRRAGELFDELCATATERVLLHGDLHHDNVLRGARQPWLAIDPHGVVGDPGYDVGSWMYNPDPDERDERLQGLVPRRIDQLADGLGMDRERVAAWAFVKAVLSCVWSAQDGGRPGSRALDVAHVLSTGMP